jgi:hypothetical protein
LLALILLDVLGKFVETNLAELRAVWFKVWSSAPYRSDLWRKISIGLFSSRHGGNLACYYTPKQRNATPVPLKRADWAISGY